MRLLTLTTIGWLVTGMQWITPSCGSPMSPPDTAGLASETDLEKEEWKWRSSEVSESQEETPPMISKEDVEEEIQDDITDIAESRSILTSILSPFVGGRPRGGARGSYKAREQGKRPLNFFQHQRFSSSPSSRFHSKGTRGRMPVSSPQPHIFQPIFPSPLGSINFPSLNTNKANKGNSNIHPESKTVEHTSNVNANSPVYIPYGIGSKEHDVGNTRQSGQSHFSVISETHPKTSSNQVNSPNHKTTSISFNSNGPSIFSPGQHTLFSTPSPSITFMQSSPQPSRFQKFQTPQPKTEQSFIPHNPPKDNSAQGFVSSNNINNIKSNLDIDGQFPKPFGTSSSYSSGFENNLFLTGDDSSKVLPHANTNKIKSDEVSSSHHTTESLLKTHQPHKIFRPTIPTPVSHQKHSRPTLNLHPSSKIEPINFVTNAPLESSSHFLVQHISSSPTHQQTTPTPQYKQQSNPSPHSFQTTHSPLFLANKTPQPTVWSSPTPKPHSILQTTPKPLYEAHTSSKSPQQPKITQAIHYQPRTTPRPQRHTTLAPKLWQSTPDSSKHHPQTTSSPKYQPQTPQSARFHTQTHPAYHRQRPPTIRPEYKSQPSTLAPQVHNQLQSQFHGNGPVISSGSTPLSHLSDQSKNQQTQSGASSFPGFEPDESSDSFGFIPFNDSHDFFNHIFGEENPFGNKISTKAPAEDGSASKHSSDFNSLDLHSHQQSVTSAPGPTALNTASSVTTHETQLFLVPSSGSAARLPKPSSELNTNHSQTSNQVQRDVIGQASISGWPPKPFRTSSQVFVFSPQTASQSINNLSKISPTDGWSRPPDDATTESQAIRNQQNTIFNTAIPLRVMEPFTVTEGGSNPYIPSDSEQNLQTSEFRQPYQSPLDQEGRSSDAPLTISATTTIEDKEFEVLVLPYEHKQAVDSDLHPLLDINDNQSTIEEDLQTQSSSVIVSQAGHPSRPFQPGLPTQPLEEEVSVYLVRHRPPTIASGSSPTPPTLAPFSSTTLSDPISDTKNSPNINFKEGKDALAFGGFPVPVDDINLHGGEESGLAGQNQKAKQVSSSSSLQGTAVSPSGRHFKFEYEEGNNPSSGILPNSLRGSLDPQGFNPSRDFEGQGNHDSGFEFEGEETIVRPFDEPDEYVQVLGQLAPPPGVVCNHGICEDEKDFKNRLIPRTGRGKKDLAVFTYEELHSPANDSYFYDHDWHKDSYVCASEVREVRPAWARTEDGSFLKIVNTDAFPQKIRMEVCRQAGESCDFLPDRVTSSCRQRYSVHKMTAEDPNAQSEETFLAAFKVPSGCFCHIRHQDSEEAANDEDASIQEIETDSISSGEQFSESQDSITTTVRNPLYINGETPLSQNTIGLQSQASDAQKLGTGFKTVLVTETWQHPSNNHPHPTLLTSSFQQSTVTTTIRPVITITTSVFESASSAGLKVLIPTRTLSPPYIVTQHFQQPAEVKSINLTPKPVPLHPLHSGKTDDISNYGQQLLDALLYNFRRQHSQWQSPLNAGDASKPSLLEDLLPLPEGLQITREGENVFKLSLRRVMRDGKLNPMNVVVKVENGFVKFITNPKGGETRQSGKETTISIEDFSKVIQKYLDVLKQRDPDNRDVTAREDTTSLQSEKVPTIHNHGSPIFIFASQNRKRVPSVDINPPRLVPISAALKQNKRKRDQKVNLVKKSNKHLSTPVPDSSTKSQTQKTNDTPRQFSPSNDVSSFFLNLSKGSWPLVLLKDLVPSLSTNPPRKKEIFPDRKKQHNSTFLHNEQPLKGSRKKSEHFNSTFKVQQLSPTPVFRPVLNGEKLMLNSSRKSTVTSTPASKDLAHIMFHLIPESLPSLSNSSAHSAQHSNSSHNHHILLQTLPSIQKHSNKSVDHGNHHLPFFSTTNHSSLHRLKAVRNFKVDEKNPAENVKGVDANVEEVLPTLLPVAIAFDEKFSDEHKTQQDTFRGFLQLPGTNASKVNAPLLSTQLFASRPQVIQNYYIKVPESYLRGRSRLPVNITSSGNEGELLLKIKTSKTLLDMTKDQKDDGEHLVARNSRQNNNSKLLNDKSSEKIRKPMIIEGRLRPEHVSLFRNPLEVREKLNTSTGATRDPPTIQSEADINTKSLLDHFSKLFQNHEWADKPHAEPHAEGEGNSKEPPYKFSLISIPKAFNTAPEVVQLSPTSQLFKRSGVAPDLKEDKLTKQILSDVNLVNATDTEDSDSTHKATS